MTCYGGLGPPAHLVRQRGGTLCLAVQRGVRRGGLDPPGRLAGCRVSGGTGGTCLAI